MPETSLLLIGTNHTFSSLTLREKIFSKTSSSEEWIKKIYSELDSQLFPESLILSTCNRVEIYTVTTDQNKGAFALKKKIPIKNLYIYTNQNAVSHLFQVAGGLDSMIIGEHEILGQVKKAYHVGISEKKPGLFMHQLWRQALHVGKDIRAKTNIGKGSTSLTNAAVSLVKKHVKDFSTSETLLIGAGGIAWKLAKNLSKKTQITVTNRTYEHAEKIANVYNIKIVPYENLKKNFATADIVISAISTSKIIISQELIEKVMRKRNRPLCFIDLGVPRNIQADVTKIENVFLYNLDDLQKLIHAQYAMRKVSIINAQEMIKKEVEIFWKWFLSRTFQQERGAEIVFQKMKE